MVCVWPWVFLRTTSLESARMFVSLCHEVLLLSKPLWCAIFWRGQTTYKVNAVTWLRWLLIWLPHGINDMTVRHIWDMSWPCQRKEGSKLVKMSHVSGRKKTARSGCISHLCKSGGICKDCKLNLWAMGRNTTNLSKHLFKHHGIRHTEFKVFNFASLVSELRASSSALGGKTVTIATLASVTSI